MLCFFKKDGILNVKLDSYFFFFVGCWVCLGEFVVKFELFLMCVILLLRLEFCFLEGVWLCYEGIFLFFGVEVLKSYKIVVKDC